MGVLIQFRKMKAYNGQEIPYFRLYHYQSTFIKTEYRERYTCNRERPILGLKSMLKSMPKSRLKSKNMIQMEYTFTAEISVAFVKLAFITDT